MSGESEIRVYPGGLQAPAVLQYLQNGSKKCDCEIAAGSEIYAESIVDKGIYAPNFGVSAPLLGATTPILGMETVLTPLQNMHPFVHQEINPRRRLHHDRDNESIAGSKRGLSTYSLELYRSAYHTEHYFSSDNC